MNLTVNNQTRSVNAWIKFLNIPCRIVQKIKANDTYTFTNLIKHILDDDLLNINNKLITVNGISLNLIDWAYQFNMRKYTFVDFAYMNGLAETKKYINEFFQPEVKFEPKGKIINIYGINNNYTAWERLCGNNIHISSLISSLGLEKTLSLIKEKLAIPYNNTDVLNIKGIIRSYEDWSVFCNQSSNYIKNLVQLYGIKYTEKCITALVTQYSHLNKNTLITVNNQSYSLLAWAKKIHKYPAYLYGIRKKYGLNYVSNYIKTKLNEIQNESVIELTVDNITKNLYDWANYFNKPSKYFINFAEMYNTHETYNLIYYMLMAKKISCKTHGRYITVNGMTKNCSEWANFLGKSSLNTYASKHSSKELKEYIQKVINGDSIRTDIDTNRYEVYGIKKTKKEWSLYFSFTPYHFRNYALKNGEDAMIEKIKSCINNPIFHTRQRIISFNSIAGTFSEWENYLNISWTDFLSYIKDYGVFDAKRLFLRQLALLNKEQLNKIGITFIPQNN